MKFRSETPALRTHSGNKLLRPATVRDGKLYFLVVPSPRARARGYTPLYRSRCTYACTAVANIFILYYTNGDAGEGGKGKAANGKERKSENNNNNKRNLQRVTTIVEGTRKRRRFRTGSTRPARRLRPGHARPGRARTAALSIYTSSTTHT